MGRFYDTASAVLVEHDAYVDKFVGDEIIGLFVPALTGDAHAEQQSALRASAAGGVSGTPMVAARGYRSAWGHTGTAYVGSVGEGEDRELTAIGDVVNTTARLASAAAEGEILITLAAASSADLSPAPLAAALAVPEGQEHPQRCS